jgi:CubicO group peptidase (beta-lactamase class C family)
MKNFNFIIKCLAGLIVLSVLSSPVVASAQVNPPGPDDSGELEVFLDSIVNQQIEKNHLAGVAVSVVRNDQVIFAKGYGYADVEAKVPVSAESTIFQIASLTKLFTWTALMQLVEQGKINLDTDINTYLDFSIPDKFDEPITMRHLMTHTAGFEDRSYDLMASSADSLEPLGDWLKTHLPACIWAPGEVIAYSNYGTTLAGYILELVSGIPYGSYITRHILEPLGMQHTSVTVSENIAPGYTYYEGDYFRKQPEWFHTVPASAMVSTADDMAAFMIAHIANGDAGILEPQTLELMHAQAFAYHPLVNGMALGFIEMDQNGQQIIGHEGVLLYSHSLLALLPEHDLGLFVVYNSASAVGLGLELLAAFLDHYFPFDPTVAHDPSINIDRFTGNYAWSRANFTTPEKLEGLLSEVHLLATDDGMLVTDTPNSTLRMAPVGPLLFMDINTGATMTFVEDPTGRIIYASHSNWPTMVMVRQNWYETDLLHQGILITILLTYVLVMIGILRQTIAVRRDQKRRVEWGTTFKAWAIHAGAGIAAFVLLANGYGMINNYILLLQGKVSLLILQISAILAMIGAASGVLVTIFAWRIGSWSIRDRIVYTLVTMVSLGFVAWLGYWNLLWIRF